MHLQADGRHALYRTLRVLLNVVCRQPEQSLSLTSQESRARRVAIVLVFVHWPIYLHDKRRADF